MKNRSLGKIIGAVTLISSTVVLVHGYSVIDKLLSDGMELRRFKTSLQGAKYLTCKNVPFQEGTADCGLRSLEAVFEYFREEVDLSSHDVDKFYSISELQEIARANGLDCEGWTIPFDSLKVPAILLLRNRHFVVLAELFEDRVRIIDPMLGQIVYTRDKLERKWTRKALIFSSERR